MLVTMTWITADLEVLLHVLNDLRGVLGDNLLTLGRDETNGTKLIVQLWQCMVRASVYAGPLVPVTNALGPAITEVPESAMAWLVSEDYKTKMNAHLATVLAVSETVSVVKDVSHVELPIELLGQRDFGEFTGVVAIVNTAKG